MHSCVHQRGPGVTGPSVPALESPIAARPGASATGGRPASAPLLSGAQEAARAEPGDAP